MPHLRLEYSDPLPRSIASRALLLRMHRVLERATGVRIGNCKSRAIPVSLSVVGNGSGDGTFVHLDVRFMEGRSASQCEAAGTELLALLVDAYRDSGHEPQITVEVRDIRRADYFKHPPGTLGPQDR